MLKPLSIFFTAFLFSILVSAQDTVTVLQYNLLNYGNFTSYCTKDNNNIDDKDGYLRTIIEYTQPDIFTVNEMKANVDTVDRLLNKVLNADGRNYFKRANYANESGGYTVNMLYYNSNLFTFYDQVNIATDYRDINLYTLYYNSPHLDSGDTVFLTFTVMHLKAGSGDDDKDDRAKMTEKLMGHFQLNGMPVNTLAMGDFNVYESSEECFQDLTNDDDESLRFNDPINKLGSWHNNSNFADYHTQATHTANDNDCPSKGGIDDRFDFILINNDIKNDAKYVEYLDDSYWAVAEDGEHFNKALIDDPANTTVPSDVLDALYNNSDHLPVTLKLVIHEEALKIPEKKLAQMPLLSVYPNPTDGKLRVSVKNTITHATVKVFNVLGKCVWSKKNVDLTNKSYLLDISNQNSGLYFLRISSGKKVLTTRFVKH